MHLYPFRALSSPSPELTLPAALPPPYNPSLFPSPQELPFWRHIPLHFAITEPRSLEVLSDQKTRGRGGCHRAEGLLAGGPDVAGSDLTADPAAFPCQWGYQWSSVVCEGARYLPWLTEQVGRWMGEY